MIRSKVRTGCVRATSFTGVVIVIIYLMVAVSALGCRARRQGGEGTFRMPLWPVPALVAIAGVIVALTQQDVKDLCIAFGIAVVSLIGYFAARRRLKDA